MDIRICVLNNRWVLVGHFSQIQLQCKLEKAAVIRRWGTTKGLGEIQKTGPTEQTILDPAGDFVFNELTSVGMFICIPEAWIDVLDKLNK